jgi:DNA-directed RNA polymerase specialized sigma24 family protein
MEQPLHDAKHKTIPELGEPEKIEAMIQRCALDPRDLEILRRVHLRYQTQVEIASAMNMSVETVGRRYRNALKVLHRIAQRYVGI